jgi:hypothetical protein
MFVLFVRPLYKNITVWFLIEHTRPTSFLMSGTVRTGLNFLEHSFLTK